MFLCIDAKLKAHASVQISMSCLPFCLRGRTKQTSNAQNASLNHAGNFPHLSSLPWGDRVDTLCGVVPSSSSIKEATLWLRGEKMTP